MRKVPSSKLGRRQFFFFCFKIIKEEYFIPVIILISVYLSLRSKFANELFGSFLRLFSMMYDPDFQQNWTTILSTQRLSPLMAPNFQFIDCSS